jgi:hypothetical protein
MVFNFLNAESQWALVVPAIDLFPVTPVNLEIFYASLAETFRNIEILSTTGRAGHMVDAGIMLHTY